MANYAVRIYDPALKAWLIAEAARRGPGVRTSDVVESALQLLKASLGGSDAPVDDIPTPPAESVRGGDASDRAAAAADTVAREPVGQPVPAVDPADRVEQYRQEVTYLSTHLAITSSVTRKADEDFAAEADHPVGSVVTPVSRVKGPDSGPDDELGF